MQEYLLFIDTEMTGLPKKWASDYTSIQRWPSAVQIAWVLCTTDGREVKTENFLISDNDVPVSSRARAIHGYHHSYLKQNGVPRKGVMQLLAADLATYHPLIVGHFVALDVHVLGADFFRCSIRNPFSGQPLFCTMLASTKYVTKPWMKYLPLEELYEELFGEALKGAHNALADAKATARSFFELLRRGEITEEAIVEQQQHFLEKSIDENKSLRRFIGLIIFILLLLIGYLVFQFYG